MNAKQYLMLSLLVSCALPHTTRPLPYKTIVMGLIFAGATWNTKQKLEAAAKEGKTQSRLFELNPYADAALVTLSNGASYVKEHAEKARETIPTQIKDLLNQLNERTNPKTSELPTAPTETIQEPIAAAVTKEEALNELKQAIIETPVIEAAPVMITEESNK